ncbi:MAG: hypothetical protein ABIB47_01920 [Candidatus Woesearchaeota archaeon]
MADRRQEIQREAAELYNYLRETRKTGKQLRAGREKARSRTDLAKTVEYDASLKKLRADIRDVGRRLRELGKEDKKLRERELLSRSKKVRLPSPETPKVTVGGRKISRNWFTLSLVIVGLFILILSGSFFLGKVPAFLSSGWISIPALILLILVIMLIFSKSFRDIFKSIWDSIVKFFRYLGDNHPYVLLIIFLIVILSVISWYIGGYIVSILTTGLFTTLANLPAFSWIIGGIISLLGLWLIIRTTGEGKEKKHTTWKLGLFLIIFGIFFGWYAPQFSSIAITTGALGAFYNLRWIVTIGLAVLGILLMLKTNAQGKHVNFSLGLVLVVLAIASWFLIPFATSELAQKYGVKGGIELEESAFIPRMKRFFYYVQHPDEYFKSYGEFTNPDVQQKGPPKGLKFVSFGPVVSSFRPEQDIRLVAEVKHLAIPSIKDNKDDAAENRIEEVTIEFNCLGYMNETGEKGNVQISPSCGNVGEEDHIVENVQRDRECTFFVRCDFEKNKFKISDSSKQSETFKATLTVNYKNFATESILKTYTIGKEKYDEIANRDNWEVELINEVRGSASFPGLIKSDRRVTSEYTGGPVQLAVNMLNSQPIYLGEENPYTLIVNTEPDSAEWEGRVKANALFVEVPGWFDTEGEDCQFGRGGGVGKTGLKRMILDEDEMYLLDTCYSSIEGKPARGCTFICDFKVKGDIQENIEEWNIKALQSSDYFLNKSTTFDIVDLGRRDEKEEEEKGEPQGDTYYP